MVIFSFYILSLVWKLSLANSKKLQNIVNVRNYCCQAEAARWHLWQDGVRKSRAKLWHCSALHPHLFPLGLDWGKSDRVRNSCFIYFWTSCWDRVVDILVPSGPQKTHSDTLFWETEIGDVESPFNFACYVSKIVTKLLIVKLISEQTTSSNIKEQKLEIKIMVQNTIHKTLNEHQTVC